jgi:hypothetical protein
MERLKWRAPAVARRARAGPLRDAEPPRRRHCSHIGTPLYILCGESPNNIQGGVGTTLTSRARATPWPRRRSPSAAAAGCPAARAVLGWAKRSLVHPLFHTSNVADTKDTLYLSDAHHCSENDVRLGQKMHVGPLHPCGNTAIKAGVGQASGPARRPSHLSLWWNKVTCL